MSPSISRKQQVAALIAEKVKAGKSPAKPGTPSAKMAQMPKKSLDDFAKLPIKTGKIKKK